MTTFTSATAQGTWAPTVLGGAGVSKGHSYASQEGTYMRIGTTVLVWGQVVLSALGTIDGSVVVVGGLPFPVKNNSLYRPTATVRWSTVTFSGIPAGTGTYGSSYVSQLTFASGGGATNLVDSALASSSAFTLALTYETE